MSVWVLTEQWFKNMQCLLVWLTIMKTAVHCRPGGSVYFVPAINTLSSSSTPEEASIMTKADVPSQPSPVADYYGTQPSAPLSSPLALQQSPSQTPGDTAQLPLSSVAVAIPEYSSLGSATTSAAPLSSTVDSYAVPPTFPSGPYP